jgi:hypothetical protein
VLPDIPVFSGIDLPVVRVALVALMVLLFLIGERCLRKQFD